MAIRLEVQVGPTLGAEGMAGAFHGRVGFERGRRAEPGEGGARRDFEAEEEEGRGALAAVGALAGAGLGG
jgi:hypothetical protein